MGAPATRQKQTFAMGPEPVEIVLRPENPSVLGGAVAALVLPANYSGSSQWLDRGAVMSRMLWRMTAATTPCTMRVLLYQATDGGNGTTVALVASADFVCAAGAQNATVSFEQGDVEFQPGIVFVLIGQKSGAGSGSVRAYGTFAYDGYTTNVDANVHAVVFTTTKAASGADPGTLNTLSDFTASTTNAGLVARLRA